MPLKITRKKDYGSSLLPSIVIPYVNHISILKRVNAGTFSASWVLKVAEKLLWVLLISVKSNKLLCLNQFINNASNAKLPVGRGPEPCTNDIQPVTFELDQHIVTLIDTPGFDGNPRNDIEILQLATTYLFTTYDVLLFMHKPLTP